MSKKTDIYREYQDLFGEVPYFPGELSIVSPAVPGGVVDELIRYAILHGSKIVTIQKSGNILDGDALILSSDSIPDGYVIKTV